MSDTPSRPISLRTARYREVRRERMRQRAFTAKENALLLMLFQYHAVTRAMIYPIAQLWGLTTERPTGTTMQRLESLGLVEWIVVRDSAGVERTRVLMVTEQGRAIAAPLHAEVAELQRMRPTG